MFIVFLRFSENKSQAPHFMDNHKQWIKQGLADDVFLVVGSLKPNVGGAIIAHNISKEEMDARVQQDPFVQQNIVSAEILEIAPNQVHQRLDFLLND